MKNLYHLHESEPFIDESLNKKIFTFNLIVGKDNEKHKLEHATSVLITGRGFSREEALDKLVGFLVDALDIKLLTTN